MGTKERLHSQIDRHTQRLAQLRARELLAEQREAVKTRQAQQRAELRRKIELGGLIMKTSAGQLSNEELVGALLAYREKVVATAEREHHRLRGATYLAPHTPAPSSDQAF